MIFAEQTSRTWTSVGSVTFVVPYPFWCSVSWYWQGIHFRKSNSTSSLCFRLPNYFHSVVHINKISPSPLRIFDNVNNLRGLKESFTCVQEINQILTCKFWGSFVGDYEDIYLPGRGIMHSDSFCDVSEAYSTFLLRVGKSLHCLLLNSEYDEAHSCLKSIDIKGHGVMFQKVVDYTDKLRCRTYSEFSSIIT